MANKTEWPKLPKLPEPVVSQLAKCLALVPDKKLKPDTAPCVMGGKPPLPEGIAWPEREGKLLHYLGRINTDAAHELFDEVPALGWLLFFHDEDTDLLQTVVVAARLGEPQRPPADSEYITQGNGPERGEVCSTLVCRLVPAWSWTYDPDNDWDEEVQDVLDELWPDNAIGQLFGLPRYEMEYARDHAMQVAAGFGKVQDEFKWLSFEKIAALRKKAQETADGSRGEVFACPKLGGRLKSMAEELRAAEPLWKNRAQEKGKEWPEKFGGVCKKFYEKQTAAVEAMAQGTKMDLSRLMEVFGAWDAIILELERARHDRKVVWLFEWSKDLRTRQKQIGKLSAEIKQQRQKEADESGIGKMFSQLLGAMHLKEMEKMISETGTRDKLHMPIMDRLMDHGRRKMNRLQDVRWAMGELDQIGDRMDFSDVTFVLGHAARVLHNHYCTLGNREEMLTVADLDALEACMRWNKSLGKEGFAREAKQWRLLFSFDSELDYCWSDSGAVRYFIEEGKLAKGEFDRVVSDISSG